MLVYINTFLSWVGLVVWYIMHLLLLNAYQWYCGEPSSGSKSALQVDMPKNQWQYRLGKTYPVDFNVMNDDHFQSTTVCNGRLEMVINNQGSPRDKFAQYPRAR